MSRHHSPVKKTPQKQNQKQPRKIPQRQGGTQEMSPNGEVVKLLRELVEINLP